MRAAIGRRKEHDEEFDHNDPFTAPLHRMRILMNTSLILSALALCYCLAVVVWVKISSPLIFFNCILYSICNWFVVYVGHKGAVFRSMDLLWAYSWSSLAVTLCAAVSSFYFFAPDVLLSHFIATVDFPKDEDWWRVIVAIVAILFVVFALSVFLLVLVNLYSAYLAFWLYKALSRDGYSPQGIRMMEAGFAQPRRHNGTMSPHSRGTQPLSFPPFATQLVL